MSQNQEIKVKPESLDRKLKSACVIQRGGYYYYPKTIPKQRDTLSIYIHIFIISALFLVDILTNGNKKTSVIAVYTLGLLINIGLNILHRIILAIEERNHLISRYDNSYKTLLKYAFHFPTRVLVAAVIAMIYAMYYFCTHGFFSDFQFSFQSQIFFLIPAIYLLGVILRLDDSPLSDSLWIAENNGLDYGSGMAYSFFHGYLKLVLPKTGTQEKNLKELMQDYEDKNQVNFAAYKLFILIPKSLNCFVSLQNQHCPSIEESSSLLEKIITVAGVKDRVYKNAVYKISPEKSNSKVYVSAEYATPLKTFKDVVDASGDHTGYYDKHKNDIILQFYLTLKKVLERTGLDAFCELIYYEDCYKNKDNNICYYDVGKVILTRLKELKYHAKSE